MCLVRREETRDLERQFEESSFSHHGYGRNTAFQHVVGLQDPLCILQCELSRFSAVPRGRANKTINASKRDTLGVVHSAGQTRLNLGTNCFLV
jgi:hypothetical protein